MGESGGRACRVGHGEAPIEKLLRNVNGDVILILFPLDIIPVPSFKGDPHKTVGLAKTMVDRSRLRKDMCSMKCVEFPEALNESPIVATNVPCLHCGSLLVIS